MIVLTATRTDCITGIREEVSVELELEQGVHGPVVRISKGAVTGYESFYYEDFLKSWDKEKAWCACAGTAGRWDKLEISSSEMIRAMDFFVKELELELKSEK